MLWIVAVGCALGGILLALGGRRGWSPLLVCAGILIFNMVLGSLGQILFEEFLGKAADLGSAGYDPGGPGRPDIPPDGTLSEPAVSPAEEDRRSNCPAGSGSNRSPTSGSPMGGQKVEVSWRGWPIVSVSSQMLVAFAQRWPRTHWLPPIWSSVDTGTGAAQPCRTQRK